ncbi:MAG TPA: hypothetical protein VI056_13080 [Candidatus Limnocylindria bacterium]
MAPRPLRGTPVSLFVAIFLLSFAALLFQFVQTRLFSAMLHYHLTFLVVSGALLGFAGDARRAARDPRRDRGARRARGRHPARHDLPAPRRDRCEPRPRELGMFTALGLVAVVCYATAAAFAPRPRT